MPLTRRQALAQLASLAALPLGLPLARWTFADDPLDGTIAEYQAGRRRGVERGGGDCSSARTLPH